MRKKQSAHIWLHNLNILKTKGEPETEIIYENIITDIVLPISWPCPNLLRMSCMSLGP